ncbi:MAG TPA: hypothetical protein VGH28_07335 [Polyangiaceae bacterium]|jgi:hypothetical protein
MRAWVLPIFAMVAACGARTGLGVPLREDASVPDAHHPLDGGVDAPIDAEPDVLPSPLCASVDASKPAVICAATVRVGAITIGGSSSCFVDLLVHEGDQGTVSYACDGSSEFAAGDFPKGTFPGGVSGTNVDLCSGTTFVWSDGCTWASAQRIAGDVASGTLTFTYDEQPISGDGCDPPCTASGPVIVQ